MKAKTFKAPTILEVEEFFNIKGCYVKKEALKFWYSYQSKGWYVGRTKMKSWRAAAIGWLLRMPEYNQPEDLLRTGPPKVSVREVPTPEQLEEIKQIKLAYENQKV